MTLANLVYIFIYIETAKAILDTHSSVTIPDDSCGNIGLPYGSNIAHIAENELTNYNYTIAIIGSSTETYDIIVWNTCDENRELRPPSDSFSLRLTVPMGSTLYMGIEDNSEGSFIAFPSGSSIPRNFLGTILGFWGEFTFTDVESFSGFGVCAFEAIKANRLNFPGLKIEGNGEVSFITTNFTSQHNALGMPDFTTPTAVNYGPLALIATIDYRSSNSLGVSSASFP